MKVLRNSVASAGVSHPSPALLWMSLLLFTLAWFGTLEYRHLIPTDEGRYANIAREMFMTGDWITPRYNGYKYFEKPVLQAWATAFAYQIFGIGDWQSRLWTALTGWLGVLAVGFTGWRLFSPLAGLFAAAMLASAPMWVGAGHFNSLDMGLSVMLELALCSLLLAQRTNQSARVTRNWMWACWIFMALAVLSKGLIGLFLPGLVLVVYTVAARDWALWKRLHLFSGLLLFAVVAAPWFIAVSLRNPEFARFFFIHEHFERFTSTTHHRTGHLLYFVPLILVGFLPWLAQLPGAIRIASQGRHASQANGFRPHLLLWLWVLLIFAFFSKSQSKLPGYIVPVFPALALLAGNALAQRFEQRASGSVMQSTRSWRWQLTAFMVLALAGFVILPKIAVMGKVPWQQAEYARYADWIATALAVLLTGSLSAWWLATRHGTASVLIFASTMLAVTLIAGLGHDELGRSRSGADLAARVRPLLRADVPLYALRGIDHTVPWYLRHNLIMVEATDELEFGIRQEPEKWVPTLADFITRWQQPGDAFAMMSVQLHAQLQAQGLPMLEIARDERRVIVREPQQ